MEADFQREYGIDLEASLDQMTWRRFCVLLAGLSADSRLAMRMASTTGGGRVITNPKEAEALFARW